MGCACKTIVWLLLPPFFTAAISGCAAVQSLEEGNAVSEEEAQKTPEPDDYDTGQYGGVILQDRRDKRNIQGFVHLSLSWATRLKPGFPRAIAGLGEAINTHTHLRAEVMDHIFLSSPNLFRKPFVYITAAEGFELTDEEVDNLGHYLKNGGFVLADNGRPDLSYGPAEASLKKMFNLVLGKEGKLARIPDNHPIYHSFFDLGGPPPGGDYLPLRATQGDVFHKPPQTAFLEGVFLHGRLVAVYADMGYGGFWEQSFDNEPQLKMGINLVVFALTQKGSITKQMDFFTDDPE